MQPSPDIIIRCPHCKCTEKFMGIASGNTFGATFYSDGFVSAPMMDEQLVDELILKAELNRHLGQFDLARQYLLKVSDPEYTPYSNQLLKACDEGSMEVVELVVSLD